MEVHELRSLASNGTLTTVPHLYLAPPQGVTPLEFREDV